MTHFLLDTNHAGSLLRDEAVLWNRLIGLTDARVGICRPSICELWFMVFNSARAEDNRARLVDLMSHFLIWELDEPASREFGLIRTELRRRGRPIPSIDVQIAAIARSRTLVLLTSDAHFAEVSGLKTEDWLRSA